MGIVHTKPRDKGGREQEWGSVKYATQMKDYTRYDDKTVKRYEKTIDNTAVRIAVALDP